MDWIKYLLEYSINKFKKNFVVLDRIDFNDFFFKSYNFI